MFSDAYWLCGTTDFSSIFSGPETLIRTKLNGDSGKGLLQYLRKFNEIG